MKKLLFVTFVLFLALCTLGLAPMQTPAPATITFTVPDAVLLLIPALVGAVAVPLINFIKQKTGWTQPKDRLKNVWLSFGVSILLAVLALIATNSFLPFSGDPNIIVAWAGLTFVTATMIYKHIVDDTQAQLPLPFSPPIAPTPPPPDPPTQSAQ